MITDIVNRGTSSNLEPSGPMSDGTTTVEMMIPSSKVGLIIGKGGETIKNLQERAGVKMVMIQDGMFANSADKPLRIKGDPQKAEVIGSFHYEICKNVIEMISLCTILIIDLAFSETRV